MSLAIKDIARIGNYLMNGIKRFNCIIGETKMNKGTFCSRAHGVTINGKFYHHPRTSEILARQIERQADKYAARNAHSKPERPTTKKDVSMIRGRRIIEAFLDHRVFSRKRRAARIGRTFTLNPLKAAMRESFT